MTQTITVAEFDAREARRWSEEKLQENVIDALQKLGWLHYHTWNSRHSVKGFPDLCAVRGSRILFAELKRESKDLEPDQIVWRNALRAVSDGWRMSMNGQLPTPEYYLWRPSDWMSGAIARVLE